MIRIATSADVPAMLSIYAPYVEQTTVSFEYTAPTPAEFAARFAQITAQFPWLVWEEDGQLLGYAYASAPFTRMAYSWCAEPSIYLAPGAGGRGVGAALYRALEALLQMQGYQVLYALISEGNAASLHFHARNGYTQVGFFANCGYKFAHWIGLHWLEKRLNFVENPLNLPTPWETIMQDDQKMGDILSILSLSQ